MNKFLNLLETAKGFDFNNNEIVILNNVISLKRKSCYITFGIKNILQYDDYKIFNDSVYNIIKNVGIEDIVIDLNYENKVIDKIKLENYFNNILSSLFITNPSFKFINDYKIDFFDSKIILNVDKVIDEVNQFVLILTDKLNEFSINCDIDIQKSDDIKSVSEIQNEINLKNENELKEKLQGINELKEKTSIVLKNNTRKKNHTVSSKIKEIPYSQSDIFEYQENKGEPYFTIEGKVFFKEVRKMKNASLLNIKISDNSDSILVQKWVRGEKELEDVSKIAVNDILMVSGKAEYNTYSKSVNLMASNISVVGVYKASSRVDNAKVKRVELHCHTKYSNLDSVSEASDYINQARSFNHKAIGFSDHQGVYAFPDINKALKYDKTIKPLYGVELSYVNDDNITITNGSSDISLKGAKYVVFDIETTGFSTSRDQIIEIAAVKIEDGIIQQTFSTFVKPTIDIPEIITNLTSITKEDVIDAPSIETVLPQFLEFSKDCILVAHNASFDVSHIRANMDRLNIEESDFLVIDTLNLSRAMYYTEIKRFNLKAISKFFKVKQEHHHRAIDDTKVTAECFLLMLNDLYKKDVFNFDEINSVINKDEIWKYVIPAHINILALNQVGFKNLYKLLSDALTKHFFYEARLLKSVLKEYSEGIYISSGCVNGEVFETALNKEEKELANVIKDYDFIQVQPPLAYSHLFDNMNDGLEVIQDTIKLIIKVAKENNILVAASSDCHYIEPELKKYRDILIASPQIGGGQHPLARYKTSPHMHFRTTDEMLNEFKFLDNDLAYEIVVTNTNLVADMVSEIECFPKKMFVPADDEFKDNLNIDSMITEMKNIVNDNVKNKYGENPHPLIDARIKRELNAIIDSGYYSSYFMSYLLVKKSLAAGYLVGSRGSVGSSLVATMMSITEINPLPPHYNCPHCKFTAFKFSEEDKENINSKEEENLQEILRSVESGYDLPDLVCPICQTRLIKDGHDIPFETFLGFNGDKVPDIDLNFSGEYQATAHEYVRELMGYDHAYRGGTVSTVASKNAYGYVKGYLEKKNITLRSAEIDRISEEIVGVKRSTGQHPGGIIVVPKAIDIYDVTPIQYPADNTSNPWITTHYDYHAFEDNLLKLDILGHDDPTMIRYFMDYVHKHQNEFSFSDPQDIPVDDKEVYKLFSQTQSIGLKTTDILSKVASYAVPEFGTNFVRQMLTDTLPKTFSELVKISGLSHGTGVWLTNAQELVLGHTEFGTISFSDVIGCRDDIMVYLMYQGLEPLKAFQIMEFVRKGQVKAKPDKWIEYKEYMISMNVPQWYIWSCEKIEYMFPKAHATAYVLMALRIAWFKVYSPALFYGAYFSKRAKAFDVETFIGGKYAIKAKIDQLMQIPNKTVKEDDLLTSLYVALEMVSRGINFLPLDINLSDSLEFKIEDGSLRLPFIALDGLGESVAIDIVAKREEKPFSSISDVVKRSKINKTLVELLKKMNSFGDLDEEEKEVEQGLFAFM